MKRFILLILTLAFCVPFGAVADETPKEKPAPADAPAKPKTKWNCWAPQDKPLRAILHYDGRQANLKEWTQFCERHDLAWCVGEFDLLTENRLAEVAEQLGRPELVNAPVIRTGLSSNGGTTILLAHKHADRMLAGVATQPLTPFAEGNEAFNFNRPNSKGDLEGKPMTCRERSERRS
jgi:hypothetical protein